MEKFLIAIGMVLSLLSPAVQADELEDADSEANLENISDEVPNDSFEEYSQLPVQGDLQKREEEQKPGQVAQPSRKVNDQVETALDSLNEYEGNDAYLGSELHKLNGKVEKRMVDPAKVARRAAAIKAAKNKKLVKKPTKEKYAKGKNIKKSGKAEVNRTPASKRNKVGLQRLGSKKRMIASLPTRLPAKRH
ncbi:MAG: hypothetical protein ABL958_04350 [Bdellovibrionia bacterium]